MSLTDVSEKINAVMNKQPAPQQSAPSTVFLSHAHADAEEIRQLGFVLRSFGFPPWWSAQIRAGKHFRSEIMARLLGSFAVIVLWTPASIDSEWVISEADRGMKRGVLVPLRSRAINESDIPPPFDTLHTLTSDDISGMVDALRHLKEPHA